MTNLCRSLSFIHLIPRHTLVFCGVSCAIFLTITEQAVRAQDVIPFPSPPPQVERTSDIGLRTRQRPASGNDEQTIPQPALRPAATQNAPSTGNHPIAPLKAFFETFDKRDGARILKAKAALSHPLDRKIAAWMIATTSKRNFSHQTLLENAAEVRDWPGAETMQLARERTLVNRAEPAAWVANALPALPSTDEGKILQIRSLLAAGDTQNAARKLRTYWVNENFSRSTESAILRDFGRLLRQFDHEARATRLLYDERANGALRLSSKLSGPSRALMTAQIAVIRRQANAKALLDALPAKAKAQPAYFFARVQQLRRADRWVEAGQVMAQAPRDPAELVDLREWWIERRMVSRKVLEAGHPKLAHKIAAQFISDLTVDQIDAHFHAGWYALRFANDPQTALHHFTQIATNSDTPISRSRAFYWSGRAHQALGNQTAAQQNYQRAGRFAHTYYGQLALRQLGQNSVALPPLPNTDAARAPFNQRYFVQVINRLNEAGQKRRTRIFYRHLAETLKDPAEITLLASLADRQKLYPISLQVGKLAVSKGVNVPRLAFPLGAIPKASGISNKNKALAYAIARQESAFNVSAVSHANARGLMQLLPETAKRTARSIGVSYRLSQLTRDGAYNAKLGSAFANQLIDRFGGSYILAFAGYNAGPGRSVQWIERFGDPRINAIDAIDWVESIPFYETRNYVQRVMENLQVYRHRLENAPLSIEADLNRGQPS